MSLNEFRPWKISYGYPHLRKSPKHPCLPYGPELLLSQFIRHRTIEVIATMIYHQGVICLLKLFKQNSWPGHHRINISVFPV